MKHCLSLALLLETTMCNNALKIYYFWFIFSIVQCLSCDKNVTDVATGNKVGDIKAFCNKNQPCIYRFCDNVDDIVLYWRNGTRQCRTMSEVNVITNRTFNLEKVDQVYDIDSSYQKTVTGKTTRNDFHHVKYSAQTNSNCSIDWTDTNKKVITFHVLKDGSILMELVNQQPRFTILPMGDFIIEFQIKQMENGRWRGPIIAVNQLSFDQGDQDSVRGYYNSIAMLISCFFLILLLFVYCTLKHLKNLAGMILMAFVATLAIAFLFKAPMNMRRLTSVVQEDACKYTSIIMYFGLISSFFWMNVMSFDIWWTLRGLRYARVVNRRGEYHKFFMYSLYAFGVPLLITVLAVVLDTIDLSQARGVTKPGFNNCMQQSAQLYIYIPITILILVNILFCILTSYNIWKIKRDVNKSPDSRKNKNEIRFILYLKLLSITGINWILDFIVDSIHLPPWLEYLPVTYNALIGVIIFAIYICKRDILILILHRFPFLRCCCCSKMEIKNLGRTLTSSTVGYKENKGRKFNVVERERSLNVSIKTDLITH